jgi:hypothetical protein
MEDHELIADAAALLTDAANIHALHLTRCALEAERAPILARINLLRARAVELTALAQRLAPSRSLHKWSKGTAQAARNYHPGPPERLGS